ncbi:hypothetical protein FHS82_001073 [Pseudochelatococcus lubricantis]|uniref:Uncharacterized protein n=1 Tax=Pseudochelatococcus lubricantis TaxID=1538102 RepID=A0ABX0UWB9_9HYPH|nr:hypothetical protein [Pseudochelatococcus lubricantis]NIJ57247.1 hypothetical protein [Pseudochelatococcus lubricantis]
MNNEQKLEILRRVSEGVDDLVIEVRRVDGTAFGDREWFAAAIRHFEEALIAFDRALLGRSERLPPAKPYHPYTHVLRKSA